MPFKPVFRIVQNRNRMIAVLALAGAVTAGGVAHAVAACSGVEQQLTDAGKREYAELVAKAIDAKVKPSQVRISDFMADGSWSAVYASTPAADDAMFFFEAVKGAKEFKEVWGGVAEPSERPELIDWAKKLGAPDNLARCFAHVVTE